MTPHAWKQLSLGSILTVMVATVAGFTSPWLVTAGVALLGLWWAVTFLGEFVRAELADIRAQLYKIEPTPVVRDGDKGDKA